MSKVVSGAIAGLAATGTMTVVILAGKAAGLLHTPPPKEITHRAEKSAGGRPEQQSQETFRLSWLAAHAAFGSAGGIGFAFLRGLLPGSPVLAGAAYGLAVWASNYLGVLPALGLYPDPEQDRNSRSLVMVGAHLVYGVTLAYTEDRLDG